jgi:hypothetical protein
MLYLLGSIWVINSERMNTVFDTQLLTVGPSHLLAGLLLGVVGAVTPCMTMGYGDFGWRSLPLGFFACQFFRYTLN